jgi:hypothetical protein
MFCASWYAFAAASSDVREVRSGAAGDDTSEGLIVGTVGAVGTAGVVGAGFTTPPVLGLTVVPDGVTMSGCKLTAGFGWVTKDDVGVAGVAGAAAFPESVTVCPTLIRFGLAWNCGLAARSAESVMPFFAAMAESVSPFATVYEPAAEDFGTANEGVDVGAAGPYDPPPPPPPPLPDERDGIAGPANACVVAPLEPNINGVPDPKLSDEMDGKGCVVNDVEVAIDLFIGF